jgi:hypothetical protein
MKEIQGAIEMTRKEAEVKAIETAEINGRPFKVVPVTYSNGEQGWDVSPEGDEMTQTNRISGWAAIEYAEQHDLRLNKYTDPIEDARADLTTEEAREIASEDPSLIYADHPVPPRAAREGIKMMTFQEFQETIALGDAQALQLCGYFVEGLPHEHGYIYLSDQTGNAGLVIEATDRWEPKVAKKYYLHIENCEWFSDDLTELERRLFEYAVSQDFFHTECSLCKRSLVNGEEITWRMINGTDWDVFCSACKDEEIR